MTEKLNRTTIINEIIKKRNYHSYLEIGVSIPENNFNRVEAKLKVGVDPRVIFPNIFLMTSDVFFFMNNQKFNMIFVDGLHSENQVYCDIKNSLASLNDEGIIIVHDCNPEKKIGEDISHSGTAWRAWIGLREETSGLKMFVIDSDMGCGVIERGTQKKLNLRNKKITWKNFRKNRKEWLNLKSVEWFKDWLEKI